MSEHSILYTGTPLSGRSTSITAVLQKAGVAGRHTDHGQPPDGLALSWRGEPLRLLKWRRGNVVRPLDELTAVERDAIARVHGIVWLIDSQAAMQSVNEYQFDAIRGELASLGVDLARVPVVFQLNKRDLPDIVSAETLKKRFATPVCEYVESIATRGVGVIEALDTCLQAQESR
jgi:hypothetical protein